MKNKLLILLLSLTVILSACNNDNEEKSKEELIEESGIINSQETEVSENPEDPEELEAPVDEENIENPVDEIEDVEEEEVEDPSMEEEMAILEENSDYISIIRMSQTGSNGKEIHVIEDLKGSLKNIVIPDIPNIQPNYEYLVFLMDSETGEITLTDMNRGLILLEDRNNEQLKIIREMLYPSEEETN